MSYLLPYGGLSEIKLTCGEIRNSEDRLVCQTETFNQELR